VHATAVGALTRAERKLLLLLLLLLLAPLLLCRAASPSTSLPE
jgi:hypothetical protein